MAPSWASEGRIGGLEGAASSVFVDRFDSSLADDMDYSCVQLAAEW